jgi:hypothetical protein
VTAVLPKRREVMRVPAVMPVLLVAAFVAGIGSAVSARSVPDCPDLIAQLRDDTGSVAIVGRNADKDRDGLIGKLDEALAKLEAEKFCDAVRKLDNFITKVGQLASAGKMSLEDANQLIGDAEDAIACIPCILGAATSAASACAG